MYRKRYINSSKSTHRFKGCVDLFCDIKRCKYIFGCLIPIKLVPVDLKVFPVFCGLKNGVSLL